MKIRFEFAIPSKGEEEVDPCEFDCCDTIEDLERELLSRPNPTWGVQVNNGDLCLLWAAIEELRKVNG